VSHKRDMACGYGVVVAAYVAASVVAVFVVRLPGLRHPLVAAAVADLSATLIVFGFSRAFDNSSLYDPYWSVAPAFIALFFCVRGRATDASPIRQGVVLTLLLAWSIRLTWNWARRWRGLDDEDWRYADFRARAGRAYWVVSLLGIHLMPTVLVYLGCLALYPALLAGTQVGPLDVLAAAVTAAAIWIEARADAELRRFRAHDPHPGRVLRTGTWAWCRHPNYLGEIAFWWGLYLFALAADARQWWTAVGPIAITVLFRTISIPMMERRMRARHPGYAAVVAAVPMLIPWPRIGQRADDA